MNRPRLPAAIRKKGKGTPITPLEKGPKRSRNSDGQVPKEKPKGVSFQSPKKAVTSPSKTDQTSVPVINEKKTKAPRSSELKITPKSSAPALPQSFTIIVGSYEKLLYGLDGSYPSSSSKSESITGKPTTPFLTPIFIFPAHVSCIKAVAASPEGGKWLATGSVDEVIKVWDLKRRKEMGSLMHHQGSITHLSFVSRSYLMSASEDGTLCLFHARDWSVLRTLKGHKDRINSVAVHPSGKLALSVGKDRTLRMWDLMRGKGSASTKLGKEAELVRWSSTGKHFAIQTQSTIDIYAIDMTLIQVIEHPARIHDILFCSRPKAQNASSDESEEDLLLVAAEDKKTTVYDLQTPSGDATTTKKADENKAKSTAEGASEDENEDEEEGPQYRIIAECTGHSNRVKSIDTLRISLPTTSTSSTTSPPTTTILASASSDGKVHVYDLSHLPPPSTASQEIPSKPAELLPISEYDTKGSRLTCLTLADGSPSPNLNEKRKRPTRDDDGDEDEDEEEEKVDDSEAVKQVKQDDKMESDA